MAVREPIPVFRENPSADRSPEVLAEIEQLASNGADEMIKLFGRDDREYRDAVVAGITEWYADRLTPSETAALLEAHRPQAQPTQNRLRAVGRWVINVALPRLALAS